MDKIIKALLSLREKFQAYEAIRESGVTNMFAIKRVSELSGLTREEVVGIMDNYTTLKERYKNEEEDEEIEKEQREDKLQEIIDKDKL